MSFSGGVIVDYVLLGYHTVCWLSEFWRSVVPQFSGYKTVYFFIGNSRYAIKQLDTINKIGSLHSHFFCLILIFYWFSLIFLAILHAVSMYKIWYNPVHMALHILSYIYISSKKNVDGRSTSSHDNKKFRNRSMEKQRGMAFGFRKTATAVIKPDG